MQSLINSKMFGLAIQRNDKQDNLYGGILTLGDYNMSYAPANSSIVWNEMVNNHYWTLNLIGAWIGGKEIPISSN